MIECFSMLHRRIKDEILLPLLMFIILQGTVKIIEEYRNRSSPSNPLECYYLFELNHDAACSSSVMPKHLSPGSICLIM